MARVTTIRDELLSMKVGETKLLDMERENFGSWRVNASSVKGIGGRYWRIINKCDGTFIVSCTDLNDDE